MLAIGSGIRDGGGGRGVGGRSSRELDASEEEAVVLLRVLVGGVNWKIAVSTKNCSILLTEKESSLLLPNDSNSE